VIKNEGAAALLTGVGPTFAGYFLQGAFKFGGYEFFKQQHINYLGYETASNYRTGVYLASAAAAEFFADIALVGWEMEANGRNGAKLIYFTCSAPSKLPVSDSSQSRPMPMV